MIHFVLHRPVRPRSLRFTDPDDAVLLQLKPKLDLSGLIVVCPLHFARAGSLNGPGWSKWSCRTIGHQTFHQYLADNYSTIQHISTKHPSLI